MFIQHRYGYDSAILLLGIYPKQVIMEVEKIFLQGFQCVVQSFLKN